MEVFLVLSVGLALGPLSLGEGQYNFRDTGGSGLLLGQNPCVSKQTCSECLQTPTCAWCSEPDYSSADGSPLPRCNQEEFYIMSSRYKIQRRFSNECSKKCFDELTQHFCLV